MTSRVLFPKVKFSTVLPSPPKPLLAMRYFTLFLLGCLLIGCQNEPTLDKDRPKESLSEVKSSLSEEKLQRFEAAWTTIVTTGISNSFGQEIAGTQQSGGVAGAVFDKTHGMTADEVISHADSLSRAKAREGR